MKKRGRGRPAMKASERQTEAVTVRFTKAEIRTLKAKAKSAGLNKAEWLRRMGGF